MGLTDVSGNSYRAMLLLLTSLLVVVSITRMALKDLTLSDGTFIPAGTVLVAPSSATHADSEYYAEPNVFNPWRFSDKREEDGENARHQFVATSTEYISFGHGKHAW